MTTTTHPLTDDARQVAYELACVDFAWQPNADAWKVTDAPRAWPHDRARVQYVLDLVTELFTDAERCVLWSCERLLAAHALQAWCLATLGLEVQE